MRIGDSKVDVEPYTNKYKPPHFRSVVQNPPFIRGSGVYAEENTKKEKLPESFEYVEGNDPDADVIRKALYESAHVHGGSRNKTLWDKSHEIAKYFRSKYFANVNMRIELDRCRQIMDNQTEIQNNLEKQISILEKQLKEIKESFRNLTDKMEKIDA